MPSAHPLRVGLHLLLSLLFTTAPAHADCRSETSTTVPPFRQLELDLDLGLDYDAGTLAGSAGYRLENWGSSPASCVSLLLNRLFTVTGVADSAGHALSFSHRVALFEDDSVRQVTCM